MVDALETASSYGISPRVSSGWLTAAFASQSPRDPYKASSARVLIDSWVPLALALNDLNRSLGHNDFYPFVISAPVAEKLEFIHKVIHSAKN
jgi:hypothetical protein